MAVRLRLMRMGKKKQPTYRIVAADSRSPRDGRFIDIVGTYDPRREPSALKVENEKAVAWLHKGALPTERVEKLLKISGAWDEFKGNPEGTSVTEAPPAKVIVQQAPKIPEPKPVVEPKAEVAEDAPAEEAPAEEVAAEETPAEATE